MNNSINIQFLLKNKILVLLISAVFLQIGCSFETRQIKILRDYHSRLTRVLDLPQSEPIQFASAPVQLIVENQYDYASLTSNTIKLNEFYQLPECGIKPLVAQRNTTLGKVQSPSQRYIYEVSLQKVLQGCQKSTLTGEQKSVLSNVMRMKSQSLEASWHALLFKSSELPFQRHNRGDLVSLNTSFGPYLSAWRAIDNLAPKNINSHSQSELDEAIEKLEPSLKLINDTAILHKLINTQILYTDFLSHITKSIAPTVNQFQCVKRQEKEKAQILSNVFAMFYISEIQPVVTLTQAKYYDVVPQLLASYANFASEVSAKLREDLNLRYQNLERANKAHIVLWQKLFKTCSISPTSLLPKR